MHARMRNRLAMVAPELDLVVIGGGINGAGVARDAALRGLRVALFESADFAAGASSKTSKLVHGGLRYLAHGALRLVWEACRERRTLLRLAPHLVRPLPFVFPVYDDSRLSPWRLHVGMWLYDLLAAFRNVRPHRMLSPRAAPERCDGLRSAGLRALALYYDAAMDDARLVLANVLDAGQAGASTLNYVEVTRLLQRDGRVCGVAVHDRLSGEARNFAARCVVACTGAWTNALVAMLPGAGPAVAPTRGTHVVVRKTVPQGFTLAAADGRIFFVMPWLGMCLVGTTDVVDGGAADAVAPTEEEIEYLLGEANKFFPSFQLRRDDVVAAFAGLRPLQLQVGAASERSREHAVLEPVPGLLCVVGGKYTTYRAVAQEVVDTLGHKLGERRPCRTAARPLPGGALPWSAREHWEEGAAWQKQVAATAEAHAVDIEVARHLVRRHGTRAQQILSLAAETPRGTERLCAHLPYVEAELRFALREEMALCLSDWFFRRSRTAYHPCHGLETLDRVAAVYAEELGWSDGERQAEIARVRPLLTAFTSPPASIPAT